MDRVEIRQDLAGLKCAWTPNNLSLTFDFIWSADGSRLAGHPSDRDKGACTPREIGAGDREI